MVYGWHGHSGLNDTSWLNVSHEYVPAECAGFNKYQLEYFWKPENRKKLILILIAMIYMIISMTPAETPNFLYFQF